MQYETVFIDVLAHDKFSIFECDYSGPIGATHSGGISASDSGAFGATL